MLSNAMQDAINEQIKNELYSAYLYLAMSAHFEAGGYSGFASWTRAQAQEEVEHAMKFYDYLNERDGRVVLQSIEQPPVEYGSPLEVFEMILAHEKKVTALINNLYQLALQENDYATQVMLHWFINEQVEEESSAGKMVDQLKMIGDQKGALIQLDHMSFRGDAE